MTKESHKIFIDSAVDFITKYDLDSLDIDYDHPNDPKDVSSNKSVHNYLEAGVKPNKIVLGVPFYGKGWSTVAATKNGLFESRTSEHKRRLDYGNIESTLLKPGSGYVRYFDYSSDSPYLYNANTQT